MDDADKSAIKALFPEHAFMKIMHPLGEAIVAIPRKQPTPEKEAAVELYHGATIRLSISV